MKRTQTILITTVILSMALTSVFAIDIQNTTTNDFIPFAAQATESYDHEIIMEAVAMPDGLYAYRMVSYLDSNENQLVGTVYSGKPSIPGPTIILTEGDNAKVTLINNACDDKFVNGPDHPLDTILDTELPNYSENSMVGIHVHGVHYDITSDASYGRMNMNGDSGALCGEPITYKWVAAEGTQGAWPYHDHTFAINEIGSEELGLFGTVIVNSANGKANGLVDGNGVSPVYVPESAEIEENEISKEFILWMVSSEILGRSIFYGNEIDYSTTQYDSEGTIGIRETALWTNPSLITQEGKNYRFHVLGLGEETHAFHIHGHRWTEDIHEMANEEDVIDVKEITPLQRHTFVIKASDNGSADETDSAEGWMYHCHFTDHMKQGMRGKMTVLPGSDDLPIVGAVFTLSDEPGLWMKTLDAGIADDLDNTLASLGLPATARNGTGFPISYISDALTPVGGNTDFSNSQGRSLAVIQQNQTVIFGMKDSQTKHTITTLVYPTNAPQIGGNGILRAGGLGHYDQQLGIRGSAILTDETGSPVGLTEPGLYAFVCKIHPYMFGAVIVDDPKTNLYIGGDENKPFPLLDLSPDLTALIRTGDPDPAALDFPTSGISPTSGLAGALLTTVYTITDPNNWKDYNEDYWNVSLPPVLVTTNTTDIAVGLVYDDAITAAAVSALDLRNTTSGIDYPATLGLELGKVNEPIPAIHKPDVKGIGEVWVNTQFERTLNKNFDGTPFDKPGTITVVNAEHWNVKKKISLPEINMNHPHNMWSDKKNEIIYQTEWFGNEMAVIDRDTGELIKEVFTGQSPSHVMTAPDTDKIYIAVNGEDTVTEFNPLTYEMERQISTGFRSHPHGHWIDSEGDYIVTPDFLGLKASIIDMSDDDDITVTNSSTILYGPIATGMKTNLDTTFYTADFLGNTMSAIDYTTGEVLDQIDLLPYGLPIQTPISPDNKWMVTALTLGAKIAVIDVTTTPGTVVDYLECDPGCHGVQWGAKEGGGYLAYVSSKFSNVLTVVDPDPAGDGTVDPVVAGHIKLANDHADNDDPIIGYQGMGGQGVLAIPNVYDGWIQQTVEYWDDVECDVPKGPKSQGQGDPQGKGPNCEIKDYLEQLDYYQKNP